MDKRFRNLILSQVEAVVHDKPAGRDSLYELLKIATPDLKVYAVDNTSQRESAYKALKILIHPDKHAKALRGDRKELQRVTRVFQETAAYYNVCVSRLALDSPGMSSNNSIGEMFGNAARDENYRETGWDNDDSYHERSRTGRATAADKRKGGLYGRYHDTGNISNKRDFRPPSLRGFASSTKFPPVFDCYDRWPYMDSMVKARNNEDSTLSQNELSWIMGCRVINLRGAVVHGQAIGRAYQVSKKSNEVDKYHDVDEVMRHFGFVSRRQLSSADEIKSEIMEHGPVVSVSFELHKSFYTTTKFAPYFSSGQVGRLHPLLIVGWTMTSAGELWRVQALEGEVFEIGTGQFKISDVVLAPPVPVLETIPWQSQGPYLDLNMPSVYGQSKDWRELRHMSISISAKELETLVSLFKGGFQQAIKDKQSFVIRDKNKLAFSRRYTLREVTTGDNGKWKISVSLAEATEL